MPIEYALARAEVQVSTGSKIRGRTVLKEGVPDLSLQPPRGEARSGNKAWLRRRLHATIVREYLEGANFYTFTFLAALLCPTHFYAFFGQNPKLLRYPHPMRCAPNHVWTMVSRSGSEEHPDTSPTPQK